MSAGLLPFAELCDALAATTRKLQKRAFIADYLRQLSVEDAARASLYLSGQPFTETDRRALNVGGSLIWKAIASLSGASEAAMHEAYRRHGDSGAAASDLFAARLVDGPTLSLDEVEAYLTTLAAARGPAAKLPLLLELLGRAAPIEAKYLIKLMLGDMRIGVKQALVEEAVAVAYGQEAAGVRHALMLNGSLPEVVGLAAAGRLGEARMRLFHPLGFMLASPVESVDEALARFAQEISSEQHAETAPQAAIRHAQLEDKYDGMRAQLHCGDPSQPGRVELFSRNREDIGASFPEIIAGFSAIPIPVILDGELLAWDAQTGRALPFSSLQQRLGRKRVSRDMLEQIPVVFTAFDLLAHGGDLLVGRPLRERRKLLEDFAAQYTATTAGPHLQEQETLFTAGSNRLPRLVLAPRTQLETADQLDRAYAEARARGNEGIMLKALDSAYQPGRRGLAWLKLKRELATLDVVVTGAEFGHGRRAAVLSDYTFAVRDGDEFKNVGKAYSGLTDAEIDELTAYFKQHTLEDFGGFRTVEPTVVLEVAFNNVMRSGRHASGFALRFPRIIRIRTDKPVREIDSLARVEEIYASQPDKPVE